MARDTYKYRSELDIIACRRGTDAAARPVVGVRWAFLPELGFPKGGFSVRRYLDVPRWEGEMRDLQVELPRSGSWAELAEDAERREPAMGPYFPTLAERNLGFLLPLLRLADPRVRGSVEERILELAGFLGHPHLEDAELAFRLWRHAPPPPRRDALAELLAQPAARSLLARFYRRRAVDFLLALAMRFEYAALLGLGLDDVVEEDLDPKYLVYVVHAHERKASTGVPVLPCDPAAPTGLHAEREPGSVPHPAFAFFAGWAPPPEILPDEPDAGDQPPELLVPRAPAQFTALSWDEPAWPDRLLSHEPVLYRVERFGHGRETAGAASTPPLPPDAAFRPLEEGELVLRPAAEPHYLDRPGMEWPPLEGWYRYRLWGVDLLGTQTREAAEVAVRHHDDLPPAAPLLRLLGEETLTFRSGDPPPEVALEIVWDAAQDFMGPDAVEFRVACSWVPRRAVPVRVLRVDEEDALKVRVAVAELPGDAKGYAGAHLTLPDGEYLIHSAVPGSPGRLTVYRSAGRAPAGGGDGVVFRPGAATPCTRIARVPRRPAAAARVDAVASVDRVEIRLSALDPAAPLPAGEPARIYLHVLRTSFDAEPLGADRWQVVEPPEGDARRDALAAWRGYADPAGVLSGSPAIVFPRHEATARLEPPAGFRAGLAFLHVTAADGASYVDSEALDAGDPDLQRLTGNESAAAEAVLSVRSLDPPEAPEVGPWDPSRRLWAMSAAVYAEDAEVELSWGAVAGAASYEVWRVLENALDPRGGLADGLLRTRAHRRPETFELRSCHVFAPCYRDRLPGRAPTRALYRVRAVGVAGEPGAWSDLIGPVYVPDVRRPPAPNLLSAGPPRAPAVETEPAPGGGERPPSEEVSGTEPERPWPPPVVERAVELVWTQPGPAGGLRFEVEAHDAARDEWNGVAATAVNPEPLGESREERALGRYGLRLEDVTPGREVRYRVVAVREAADPIDPAGQTMRDICGAPSRALPARATGRLRAPSGLAATYDAAAERTALSWKNRDRYEAVDVGRKGPGGFRFEWLAASGGESQAAALDGALDAGRWTFRLRARGFSRSAKSEDVTVEVT